MSDDVKQRVSVVDVDESFLETVAAGRQRMFSSEQERVCLELIAARKRIAELEAERDYLRTRLYTPTECPPVQKLATSGPSITRPVPAVDAWVTYARPMGAIRWRVSGIETADGHTRIICGPVSLNASDDMLTGPSDRGPWRPIGEVL